MDTEELPWYTDRCPRCQPRRVVPPSLVRRATTGNGVRADYLCPRGHTWSTNWMWWENRPHDTDDLDDLAA